MTWIVVGGAAAVLGLWAALVYRRLQVLRHRARSALAQIDDEIQRRHDLLLQLVQVARGYMAHEAATLDAVNRARSEAVQAASVARSQPGSAAAIGAWARSEAELDASLARWMALAQAYPGLKADPQMQALGEEITRTDNRLGMARQAYNDHVLAFNDSASNFPDVLLARGLGFAHMATLNDCPSATKRPAPPAHL